MRRRLQLHPDLRCDAVRQIEVEIRRPGPDALDLTWRLEGDPDRLRLPPPAPPGRADELWRHTCFEAFLRGAGDGYREFNLAPSRQWAAYRFDGYRAGMRPLEGAPDPGVALRRTAQGLELSATLPLEADAARLGLSAVIEEADGRISYWALAHPAGKPDFHHADCFALELPAPLRP